MSTVVRNDGKVVSFPLKGQEIPYPVKGQPGTVKVADIWKPEKPLSGWGRIAFTHDFRVEVGGYVSSDPVGEIVCRQVAEKLGLQFELDDPRTRVQHLRNEHGDLVIGWERLLEMWESRDVVRPANYVGWDGYEWSEDGLVYQITLGRRHPEVNPYDAREVRREANLLIQTARRWIHRNLRSFKRVVDLSDYEAVKLHKIATSRKIAIIGVRSGETKTIRRMSGQKFGSGGSWARWEIFGEVTEGDIVADRSNNFVDDNLIEVTFDKGPAVLYTAAGDGINGGRLHYKVLYVVDPTGDLAVSAAPESR